MSNDSEGSIEGVYNVNADNDHINLSMFDDSHHTNATHEHLYIENPILPTQDNESDDSYEAVRLATFIARPSPLPTPHLTGRRQQSASHLNPAFDPNEDDDLQVECARTVGIGKTHGDMPVYAQVDLAKKERDRVTRYNHSLEQMSDDMLI